MSKRKSRLLVIDASVARAAGKSEHPVSSACQDFLLAVLRICHKVALDKELNKEWNEHQSRFTRKWRRSMAARQKPLCIIKPASTNLDLEAFSEKHQKAIQKDLHLIETALAVDHEIVLLDDTLLNALGEKPHGQRLRDSIKWHHPVRDGVAGL